LFLIAQEILLYRTANNAVPCCSYACYFIYFPANMASLTRARLQGDSTKGLYCTTHYRGWLLTGRLRAALIAAAAHAVPLPAAANAGLYLYHYLIID
jgi:hypothetical protein